MPSLFTRIFKKATFYVVKQCCRFPEKQEENGIWSDLPPDLLSLIAERGDLFDLQSFYRVCKAWNSASSAVLTQYLNTELNQGPWFLLYDGKSSECKVLTGSGKRLTTSIPGLAGTTCLATYHGWLLLFQQGCVSMFFLHIFSRQRIDLPVFPESELTDHVAAVSCPPTSKDCVVCVISRISVAELEATVLKLGEDKEWTKIKYYCTRAETNTIQFAVYHFKKFCFFDHRRDQMLTLSTENRTHKWRVIKIRADSQRNNEILPGVFFYGKDELKSKFNDMKYKLGLTDGVSVSTCGTTTQQEGFPKFIFNEGIRDHNVEEDSKGNHFKGVWIDAIKDSEKPNNKK